MPDRVGPARRDISLTQDRLEKLSCIAHVGRMIPLVGGMVVTTLGNRPEDANVSSGAGEDPEFRKRVVVGRSFDSDDEKSVLLSEMFAHRIGLVDDADLDQVIGKPLRIEIRGQEDGPSVSVMLSDRSKASGSPEEYAVLRQLAWQIPGALDRFSLTAEESAALRKAIRRESAKVEPVVFAGDFRVVGIFRELTDDERKEAWSQFPADTDLVLPRRTAVELMLRDPARREEGVDQVVLFVDEVRNVKEVVNNVKALGMQSRSIVDFIERQRLTYLLIFGGMTCVAGVALLVASFGIANTMLMKCPRKAAGDWHHEGRRRGKLAAPGPVCHRGGPHRPDRRVARPASGLVDLLAGRRVGPLDGPPRHGHRPLGLDLRLPGLDRRDGRHVHRWRDDRRGCVYPARRGEARPRLGADGTTIGPDPIRPRPGALADGKPMPIALLLSTRLTADNPLNLG